MTFFILTLGGWAVVAYVVLALPVVPAAQAIFYCAAFVALAGSWALLLRVYYQRRLDRHLGTAAALGSGMRFALAAEFALWLQSLRMLTPAYAALLVAGYLLAEYLFRSLAPRSS